MLNLKFNKDKDSLNLEKFLDDVDFNSLTLSKSGKSYSVSYDRIEFITKEGVLVKGALTLYAPKDDYEDWQLLRSKGKHGHEDEIMTMNKDDFALFKEFLEFKKAQAK
jgi:hypothetical protein